MMTIRRVQCTCVLPFFLFLRRLVGLSGSTANAPNAAKVSVIFLWVFRLCLLLMFVLLGLYTVPSPKPMSFREPPWASMWDSTEKDTAPEADEAAVGGPQWSPRFVHQTWRSTALPPQFAEMSKTWRRCFPRARHVLWSDDDNRRFIQRYYPWFLRRYDALPAAIYRADAIRYLLLFHYGGIYADLDAECVRPFSHLLANHSIVLGAMKLSPDAVIILEEGLVQNSFMYSRPRHPFWLELIHYIMAKPVNDRISWPEAVTGPTALMYVLRDYRRRFPNAVAIYPPRFFNPFSWMVDTDRGPCRVEGRMTPQEFKDCRHSLSRTGYVVQYHFHTWSVAPPRS